MEIRIEDVPRETHQAVDELYQTNQKKLNHYADQLIWWNQKINLISRSISRGELQDHIKHCLYPAALDLIDSKRLIDSGSGGGLPGIPLAITDPEKQVILNDIVKKKLFAAQQIARTIDAPNIDIVHSSIDEVHLNPSDIIVSKHAFKIPDLLSYLSGTSIQKIILYKGSDWKDEIDSLNHDRDQIKFRSFQLDTHHSNSFYQGKVILEIKISPLNEQRRTST
jgi:16S rRNA (guanine527-N7)-methyltransferase